MVSHIRIDVVSSEGVLLLGETRSIRFGTEGLLGVAERFEVNSSSVLCFPTKDEAGDITNKGDPFTTICGIFSPWEGLQIKSAMLINGYSVSEDGKAQLWIRAERNTDHRVSTSVIGHTDFPTKEEPCAKTSREHLPPEVKARMKSLCNDICPRSGDGIMLPKRGHLSLKRSAWCLDEIINILGEEFYESQLKGARDKALKYMSHCIRMFKRLKNVSAEAWEAMGEVERERKSAVLHEFESSANHWRLGAYGSIWEGGRLRRKPTGKELSDFKNRVSYVESKPVEPKQ
jgi:hypothetical protein